MFKHLDAKQKRLLLSFLLFGLAAPIIFVYANTFIWREFEDPLILGLFNIANYIGVTIGFIVNLFLLKLTESGKLYAIGCFLQGAVPIALFQNIIQSSSDIILLGLVLGIAQGIFWANRNVLTSKYSQGSRRIEFISIETAFGIATGIIAPFLIGWFIYLSSELTVYTVDQAYQFSSILGLIALLLAGSIAWQTSVEPIVYDRVFLRQRDHIWNKQRLAEMINGIANGIESVLPLVIIFFFLGQEEAIGTIKALTSLLSAIVLFILSSKINHHENARLFSIWLYISLAGSAIFTWWYSAFALLIYFVLHGLVASMRWSPFMSVMYDVIDSESSKYGTHRYIYLLDREITLNTGRVIGLILFILLYYALPDYILRYGLILLVLLQIPNLFLLRSLMKDLSTN